MSSLLRSFLVSPLVQGVPVDDDTLLKVHARIILEKPLLRSAFRTFYTSMAGVCDTYFRTSGLEVELGSGAGFFKHQRPGIVTSDLRGGVTYDRVLDAQALDLPDNSVRCVYAINVLHHLPQPRRFFDELCRVLRPGGGCILIEPHGGFASSELHKRLHKDEFWDASASRWENTEIGGTMSGANQALAHIIFTRDINLFNAEYAGRLTVAHRSFCRNALRYFFSGGLNFKQLLPSLTQPLLQCCESVLPLPRFWTLHELIAIQRTYT